MNYKKLFLFLNILSISFVQAQEVRKSILLNKNWSFSKGDFKEASQIGFNDTKWQKVTIPHDWAIYGPFDENNDVQKVAITQNLEKEAKRQTGRTGGLPYMGVGWYRTSFNVPDFKKGQRISLVFDGAMSEAHVSVNGKEAIFLALWIQLLSCRCKRFSNRKRTK